MTRLLLRRNGNWLGGRVGDRKGSLGVLKTEPAPDDKSTMYFLRQLWRRQWLAHQVSAVFQNSFNFCHSAFRSWRRNDNRQIKPIPFPFRWIIALCWIKSTFLFSNLTISGLGASSVDWEISRNCFPRDGGGAALMAPYLVHPISICNFSILNFHWNWTCSMANNRTALMGEIHSLDETQQL